LLTPSTATLPVTTLTSIQDITVATQVACLLQFGIDVDSSVLTSFIIFDKQALLKNTKDKLVEWTKKIKVKTRGNKPIDRIHTHLLYMLQTNNNPITSIPPPPVPLLSTSTQQAPLYFMMHNTQYRQTKVLKKWNA
jgi:hypothetical protein